MTKEEWDDFLTSTLFEERELVAEKLGVEDAGIAAALERTLGEVAEECRIAANADRETE